MVYKFGKISFQRFVTGTKFLPHAPTTTHSLWHTIKHSSMSTLHQWLCNWTIPPHLLKYKTFSITAFSHLKKLDFTIRNILQYAPLYNVGKWVWPQNALTPLKKNINLIYSNGDSFKCIHNFFWLSYYDLLQSDFNFITYYNLTFIF